ncbi:MAG: DUF2179 domain-containing protein [Anaerolineae bacterium]|nr:DUF2179 domain-containing protein [Anaerolineae bacterium]NIN99308.1 DUF2179 domain-containing protein [Anaerolineae bacterium]NIQ82173.1 DUF2179 domain-containing protein [Anaerolineae bacterium]
MEILLGALLIFCLRLIDVSMGTVRMLMAVRGRRLLAGLIGFFEVTIFLVAISQVVTNIGNWWNVVAYAGGFATGTIVGMTIENKLAIGLAEVSIISMGKGTEIAEALREDGYGATEFLGVGQKNVVDMVRAVVRRREVPAVMATTSALDDQAFVTVQEMQRAYRGRWRLRK